MDVGNIPRIVWPCRKSLRTLFHSSERLRLVLLEGHIDRSVGDSSVNIETLWISPLDAGNRKALLEMRLKSRIIVS